MIWTSIWQDMLRVIFRVVQIQIQTRTQYKGTGALKPVKLTKLKVKVKVYLNLNLSLSDYFAFPKRSKNQLWGWTKLPVF